MSQGFIALYDCTQSQLIPKERRVQQRASDLLVHHGLVKLQTQNRRPLATFWVEPQETRYSAYIVKT